MICTPCREDNHGICPERLRQARLAQEPLTVRNSVVINLAASTGQRCDCRHFARGNRVRRDSA